LNIEYLLNSGFNGKLMENSFFTLMGLDISEYNGTIQ